MGLINDLAGIMKKAESGYDRLMRSVQEPGTRRIPDGRLVIRAGSQEPAFVGESGTGATDTGALQNDSGRNRLVQADNAEYLARELRNGTLSGAVDLIYCDPPFFTREQQSVNLRLKTHSGESCVRFGAYDDSSAGDFSEYLSGLALRLMLMREALTGTGSIFIHLDWHSVHAVKLIMDEIFGQENFVNEIVWTYKSGGSSTRKFARKHDTILFYSKSPDYIFHQTKEKSYNRKFRKYSFQGVEEFCDEVGWYTMVNARDVWQIDMVGRSSGERLGYATQKPLALVKRIIEACTDEGALCADFFSGSGTLAEAAHSLGRRFLCVDAGALAISSSVRRLLRCGAPFELMALSEAGEPQFDFLVQHEGAEMRIVSYEADPERFPLRNINAERAREVYRAEPLAFVDFWCAGSFDECGCFAPLTGACGAPDQAAAAPAAAVFDVFGRCVIKKV